eukprot:1475571-Pyramimonas_sp.AAC.1
MDFLVVDAAARRVEELGGRQVIMPRASAVRRRRARCRVHVRETFGNSDLRQQRRGALRALEMLSPTMQHERPERGAAYIAR